MKAIYSFFIIALCNTILSAEPYEIGHGLKLHENMTLGGYFSTDYKFKDDDKEFRLDDVALLAYGALPKNFSYLLELESAPTYTKNFTKHTETTELKFHYERAYVDYAHSERINLRVGKQITPIGYWNLEPINVLRDTSSSPLYSNQIFPKLFTGLDLYGFIDEENRFSYHLFVQKNKDLDENYINIKNEDFSGLALGYEYSDSVDMGASYARYVTSAQNKHVRLGQANMRYTGSDILLQAEIAFSRVDNRQLLKKFTNTATYIQGVYSLTEKHALVGRYEYFDNKEQNSKQHIGILGYSYRPIYPVSLKAEHQFNSDANNHKSIISFSVLF